MSTRSQDRRVFDYSILLGRAVNMLDKVNGAFSLALVSILTQKQYVHDSSALERYGKRTLTSLLSESCLSERTLIVLCGGLTRQLSPRSAASSQQLSPFVRTYGRLTSPAQRRELVWKKKGWRTSMTTVAALGRYQLLSVMVL